VGRLPHPAPHYASLQLAAGTNVVQLSRALGHHSAAFTLDVYAHLLDGEEAPALELVAVLPRPTGTESSEDEEE
jgi:integrase